MENREQKGHILKQAREEKGLSLESVHAATKIPMDILRALEEGYTVRTLTSFYYRGFVKIYAKHLGIDLATVLNDKIDKPAEVVKPPRLTISRPPRFRGNPQITRRLIQAFLILLALFILMKGCSLIKNKARAKSSQPGISSADIQKPILKKEAATSGVMSHPSARNVEKIVQDMSAKAKREVPTTAPAAETSVVPPQEDQPSQTKTISLTVKAGRNSWLKVLADHQVVFQGTLVRGGLETWSAKENIEISGKNLNLLEFEFNGKFIGTLGKENRQIKKVIFTKDGLSVQK